MPRSTELNKPGAMLDAPKPPTGMSAEGKVVWKAAVALRPAAEWTAADTALLAMHVRAVLDVRRLDAQLEVEGELTHTTNGTPMAHPLVNVRAARERLVLQTATRLKLTPSTRYTGRRADELLRHANKASHAQELLDSDDLLAPGGFPGALQ